MNFATAPEEDFNDIKPSQPITVVCVDGTEESERALRWAMRNVPQKHGLMLVHGAKIPWSASLEIKPKRSDNLKRCGELSSRYQQLCEANGRRCAMAHLHFQRGDAFGDHVCDLARLRGAQAVITGRRDISNARRAIMGSSSEYILKHCDDIPVTIVPSEDYDE